MIVFPEQMGPIHRQNLCSNEKKIQGFKQITGQTSRTGLLDELLTSIGQLLSSKLVKIDEKFNLKTFETPNYRKEKEEIATWKQKEKE